MESNTYDQYFYLINFTSDRNKFKTKWESLTMILKFPRENFFIASKITVALNIFTPYNVC